MEHQEDFIAMNRDLMDFNVIFMGYDEVIIFTFDGQLSRKLKL